MLFSSIQLVKRRRRRASKLMKKREKLTEKAHPILILSLPLKIKSK
jgi:hypothetical protein